MAISDDACNRAPLQALEMLGVDNVDDFNELYDQIDKDNSGSINKEEFTKWWMGQNSEEAEKAAIGVHPLSIDLPMRVVFSQ